MSGQAGWAQVEITPPLGLPMGGRGPRFTPGVSVLDPLMAQAVALSDEAGNCTLWVSLDLIGMAGTLAEGLIYDVSAMTGVPYEAVVVNYAHPHSGPMINHDKYPVVDPKPAALVEYEREVRRKVALMARQAVDRMRPVTVALHKSSSQIGINRRNRDENGVMAMRPNPDGIYNPELWVLDITALDGDGRCVVFNYGCHPVIVYGFAWDAISADYPGACRRYLRQELGADVHCQFIQGLAGDVRPRVLADLEEGRFRKSRPEDLERVGRQLADDVLAALADEGEQLLLRVAAVAGRFMARRDPARIPPLAHWQEMAGSDDELTRNVGRYWVKRLREGPPPIRAMPMRCGLVQLAADRRVAWLAGEAVAEWKDHLRHWLGDDQLTVWGYCQEVPTYLPTDELLPEGGYEVDRSNLYSVDGPGPFAAGLNEAVRRRFLAMARQL